MMTNSTHQLLLPVRTVAEILPNSLQSADISSSSHVCGGCGAGAFGVAVRMLYEVVPFYYVSQTREFRTWDELKAPGVLSQIVESNEHVEVWITPIE